MKLWITGAGGFIGRHLVEQAARAGHEVVAILRPGSRPRAAAPGTASLALDLHDAAKLPPCKSQHEKNSLRLGGGGSMCESFTV